MKHIVLLCSANRKGPHPQPALELYRSSLYRYGRAYALAQRPDFLYLLSASYGLLEASRVVEPYPHTMTGLDDKELETWALLIRNQLRARHERVPDRLTLLALDRFAAPLLRQIPEAEAPLRGMRMQEAAHWLRNWLADWESAGKP
jgi:hypothetical protein